MRIRFLIALTAMLSLAMPATYGQENKTTIDDLVRTKKVHRLSVHQAGAMVATYYPLVVLTEAEQAVVIAAQPREVVGTGVQTAAVEVAAAPAVRPVVVPATYAPEYRPTPINMMRPFPMNRNVLLTLKTNHAAEKVFGRITGLDGDWLLVDTRFGVERVRLSEVIRITETAAPPAGVDVDR